jgi:hypothetical protein
VLNSIGGVGCWSGMRRLSSEQFMELVVLSLLF